MEDNRDLSYKAGNMCGGCLHHKGAHTVHVSGLYQCASCGKFCDPLDYAQVHKSTMGTAKAEGQEKKDAFMQRVKDTQAKTAPLELTGR